MEIIDILPFLIILFMALVVTFILRYFGLHKLPENYNFEKEREFMRQLDSDYYY